MQGLPNNKFNMQVASLIDNQIYKGYKLTCNNYIAHDMRSQSERYASNYTEEEKKVFMQHYEQVRTSDVEDKKILEDIFLGIYANPVDSHL
jgi:hypothetical protein